MDGGLEAHIQEGGKFVILDCLCSVRFPSALKFSLKFPMTQTCPIRLSQGVT